MSDLTQNTHYKQLITTIFGPDFVVDKTQVPQNNIIRALNSSDNFKQFRAAFTARLKRIASAYNGNSALGPAIKQALNQIADYDNCNGAYAELAVIDFLVGHPKTQGQLLKLDVTLPAKDTLASDMGYDNANLDGFLTEFGIYFDTKILSDKSGDIVKGIIDQVLNEKSIKMTVQPSFNADIPFEDFQKNRRKLYEELFDFIDPVIQPKSANSTIVDSLTYNFGWGPGVLIGANEYNPLTHAKNHHTLLFKHAKKFHRSIPSIIVFVHFPWFSEKLSPFNGGNKIFYREFAQLFFDGYKDISDDARIYNSSFKTSISAYDVTKKLSAIIFLEDNSILSEEPNDFNIAAYCYVNDNADNSLSGHEFLSYLQQRGVDLELITKVI